MRGRVLALLTMIQQQPRAGHRTSRPGVLRIAVVPYPYLIDYRVTDEEIIVQRFRHGARRPLA